MENYHGKALGDKGKAAVEKLKEGLSNEKHNLGPQPVVDDAPAVDLSPGTIKLSEPPSYKIGDKVIISHSFLKCRVGSLSFEEETGKNPLRNKLFYTVMLLHTFLLINCICRVFLFCFTHMPQKRIADMYIVEHGCYLAELVILLI